MKLHGTPVAIIVRQSEKLVGQSTRAREPVGVGVRYAHS